MEQVNIQNLFKKSFLSRVPAIVADRGISISEAIKVAYAEESELISELSRKETDRSKKVHEGMARYVWNRVKLQKIIDSNR